ncbi:MAG: hypothetical protein IJD91_06885 [Clostridia bacterium]|nr:hypothetical protein [Clostridia bacterium]
MINKKVLEFLCKKTQKELKRHLKKQLKAKYETVISEDGFLFAKGSVPILLVAHMDTVHKELPKQIVYSGNKMSSPQGIGADDRLGVYGIMEIIKKYDCSVMFCEDEEIGCVGAEKFVDFLKDLIEDEERDIDVKEKYGVTSNDFNFNYIIELDRRGSEDAVFYDCDNPEFEEFITESGDWKTTWGSFSDISELAPALGCAAVNLSCGYYNAHTANEYVVLDELEESILKTCRLIEKTKAEDKFEWVESTRRWYGGGWDYYDDYYGDYGYGKDAFGQYTYGKTYDNYKNTYIIMFRGEDGYFDWEDIYADSKIEAVGMFLMDHPDLTYADIEIECYEYESSSSTNSLVPYKKW